MYNAQIHNIKNGQMHS